MLSIDLAGRVALVLGGSRGIGAGIVEALCRAGATTWFTHRGRPEHEAQVRSLQERIREAGGDARDAVADACSARDTESLIRGIADRHGRLDALVCNVGQTLRRPLEQVDDESWRRFLDINLSSSFYGVRAALPHMTRAGYGKIVLIGSSAVYDGGGGAIDYASAKAAMEGMMRYLARNYTRRGVRVNVVHPCVIDTELLREGYDTPEKQAQLAAQVPAGRLGQVGDIANLVAFLVSPMGDFICAQSILVDGGRTSFR
jgi:3-oxoacyl-[acyl-carrier protein] reductase